MDDDFQEELQRRAQQISSLKDDLWNLRDRADEAEAREAVLRQGLVRLRAELSTRRSCANSLEDQAHLREAEQTDGARRLNQQAAKRVEELAQLQLRLAEEEDSGSIAATAADEERRCAGDLEAEAVDAAARLQEARKDVARAQEALEREEVAERERSERISATRGSRDAVRITDAEREAETAQQLAASHQAQVANIEARLAEHSSRTSDLKAALLLEAEKRQLAARQCDALERALRAREARESADSLEDTRRVYKSECQTLQKELHNSMSDNLMRTNGLHGAIEETQRMMKDHVDQTQNVPEFTSLLSLKASLSSARASAAAAAAAARRGEELREAALAQRLRAEEATQAGLAARAAALARHAATLAEDNAVAKRALDDSERREREAEAEAQRLEEEVAAIENLMWEREMALRAKLNELWQPLRWQSITCAEGS